MCEFPFRGEVMILAKNHITEKGVLKLAKSINNFPNLKLLDLRGN